MRPSIHHIADINCSSFKNDVNMSVTGTLWRGLHPSVLLLSLGLFSFKIPSWDLRCSGLLRCW